MNFLPGPIRIRPNNLTPSPVHTKNGRQNNQDTEFCSEFVQSEVHDLHYDVTTVDAGGGGGKSKVHSPIS